MTDAHDHPAADLHVPVLLATVVEQLRPRVGLRMLDCTLGMGGHSAFGTKAGDKIMWFTVYVAFAWIILC